MGKSDQIMQRMKEYYEAASKQKLVRRIPVILRIDGKAFHTFTKGLDKPFDEGLIEDMIETTKFLCANISGAKIGYTQSDEISILLTDYDKLDTQPYFNYEVDKLCSIVASMATAKFNELRLVRNFNELCPDYLPIPSLGEWKPQKLAMFDCRAFNVPREDVSNYFLARQRDAIKNSKSMLAQSVYSHEQLKNKNGDQQVEMSKQKGLEWKGLHYSLKQGTCILKRTKIFEDKEGQTYTRNVWEECNIEHFNYNNLYNLINPDLQFLTLDSLGALENQIKK